MAKQGSGTSMGRALRARLFGVLTMTLVCGPVSAGSFDVGELSGSYKLTLNYGVGVRMQDQDQRLIAGEVDPLLITVLPGDRPGQPPQLVSFGHTGLPTQINFDDGNRNFDKYSAFTNRASILGELEFTYRNYGLVVSGDAFYDWAYTHRNDNDSPDTVNKTGPNDEFTEQTETYDGRRARLLDAYVYGDWFFGEDISLNLRLGQHLVAFGDSLFFLGMASSQSPADATKAFVPGAEVKQILLPTQQVSMSLGIGYDWTILGYYKLEYANTEIFPVGDYFSPSDAVGPGATFVYGSINPVYLDGCPGLLPEPLDQLCNLGGIGAVTGATPTINSYRAQDIKPSDHGQWGAGIKYQLSGNTNVGLYYLRYHDTNPAVILNPGFAPFATIPPVTTQIINQYVPVTYNVKYFDGIDMAALGLSTTIGPVNFTSELSYRHNAVTSVQADVSDVLSPIFTRGDFAQLLMSGIYAANPHFFFDDLALVGEFGYLRLLDAEVVESTPGIIMRGNGDEPFYDEDSAGFQTLAIPTRHNLVPGWDFSLPISYGYLFYGNPSMSGAFGPLYGEGDQRLSVGVSMRYLQNLQVGVSYNMFFGDAGKTIGESTLKANPYVDRNYLSFNVKYLL